MSITLIAAIYERGPKDSTQRAVLQAMAYSVKDAALPDDPTCWPSYKTLADRCAMSRTTVMRATAALEAGGWITIEAQTRANGSITSNIFHLNIERLLSTDDSTPSVKMTLAPSSAAPLPSVNPTPPSSVAPLGGYQDDTSLVANCYSPSVNLTPLDPESYPESYPELHPEFKQEAPAPTAAPPSPSTDPELIAAREATFTLIAFWEELTKRRRPGNDDQFREKWVEPFNQIWIMCGRSLDAAKAKVQAVRDSILAGGGRIFDPSKLPAHVQALVDAELLPMTAALNGSNGNGYRPNFRNDPEAREAHNRKVMAEVAADLANGGWSQWTPQGT